MNLSQNSVRGHLLQIMAMPPCPVHSQMMTNVNRQLPIVLLTLTASKKLLEKPLLRYLLHFVANLSPDGPSLGRSQDSVNGGAQLGAVTRAYIARIINRERWVSSGSFIAHPSRTCEARQFLGVCSPRNFSILDFL